MKRWIAFVLVFVSLMFLGCSLLNENPPDYVKDVSVLKEGDGLMIYFILADANQQMTTSDGKVTLLISEYHTGIPLFEKNFEVKKGEFEKAEVGMGPFKHDVILYSIGRVKYSAFKANPFAGKLNLTFRTPNGKSLQYRVESIIF